MIGRQASRRMTGVINWKAL